MSLFVKLGRINLNVKKVQDGNTREEVVNK